MAGGDCPVLAAHPEEAAVEVVMGGVREPGLLHLQYSTVQYRIQYSTVQYTVQYCTVSPTWPVTDTRK